MHHGELLVLEIGLLDQGGLQNVEDHAKAIDMVQEQGKLFEKGVITRTVPKADYTKVLMERIMEMTGGK